MDTFVPVSTELRDTVWYGELLPAGDFHRELLSGGKYGADCIPGALGAKRITGPGPMLYAVIYAAHGNAPASDFHRELLSGGKYAADCMPGALGAKAAWGPGVANQFDGQWDVDGTSTGAWDTAAFTWDCDGTAVVEWVTDSIPDNLHWLGDASSTGIWKTDEHGNPISDYWHADGAATGIWDIAVEALTGQWNVDGAATGRWDLPFGVGGNCLSGSGEADVETVGAGVRRNYVF